VSQPVEALGPVAAARWLRKRGFAVADNTVSRWCQPGGALADGVWRTPGGKVRVRVTTLVRLLRDSGIDDVAA
jgi:hypothetical protein